MKKLVLLLTTLFISVFSFSQIQIDSVVVSNVQCAGGCDGSLTVFTSGGTGTEMFDIGGTPQSNNIFVGLCGSISGVTITVSVSDAALSSASTNISITENPSLIVFANNIPSTCGNSNGSATAIVSGGTGAGTYSYLWNDLHLTTTSSIINLSAANYSVTVTDNNGCLDSVTVFVMDLPIPIIDSIVTTNISCFGFSDGTVTVFASGSTFLSYSWDDPMGQFGPTAVNLAASLPLYSVIVTDNNGCTTSAGNIQLTQPAPLSANINAPNIVCYGEEIQLFANANGGTLPYNDFAWTGDINYFGQGPILDTLTTDGTYNLVVTDYNGCTSAMASHVVSVRPEPSFSISSINICIGDTGVLTPMSISGGNPNNPYYFNWMEVDSATSPVSYIPLGVADTYSDSPDSTKIYCVFIDNVCALSDTFCANINVNTCTGISEETQNNFATVYPNPTNGIINLEFNQNITYPILIEVIDFKGQVVQADIIKRNKSSIDLSSLPKGLYILNNKELKLQTKVILE